MSFRKFDLFDWFKFINQISRVLRFSNSSVLCVAFRLFKTVNTFVVAFVFIRTFSHQFYILTSTILYWGYVMQATAIFFAVYKIVSEILISLLRQKNAKGLIVQQRNKRRLGRTTNYPLEQLENFLKNLKPRLMRCT